MCGALEKHLLAVLVYKALHDLLPAYLIIAAYCVICDT